MSNTFLMGETIRREFSSNLTSPSKDNPSLVLLIDTCHSLISVRNLLLTHIKKFGIAKIAFNLIYKFFFLKTKNSQKVLKVW